MINFKTDLMSTLVSYACFVFQTKMKKFSWKTEQKKWKHTLATGHYSCCMVMNVHKYVKGHIVERMQINMVFAAALHILYLLTFLLLLLLLLGEGVTPLVQDCQDHCNLV